MKLIMIGPVVLVFMISLVFQQHAEAQYAVPKSVFGNGGTTTAGSGHRIMGTLGQSAIGTSSSASNTVYAGFWHTSGSAGHEESQILVIDLCAGWNMLSFPGEPVPNTVADIVAGTPALPLFYTWDGSGYISVTTVEFGAAYWVASPEEYALTISYLPRDVMDRQINYGWTMVGSVDCVVPVANLTSAPSCHVSLVYTSGCAGGHVPVTEMLAGVGYWVPSGCATILTLDCSAPLGPIVENALDVTELVWESALTVQSQGQQRELMFGVHPSATSGVEMPSDVPLPPPVPTTSSDDGKQNGKDKGIPSVGWLTEDPAFPMLSASYIGVNDPLAWKLSVNLSKSGKVNVDDLPDGYDYVLTENGQPIGNGNGSAHLDAGEHEITLTLAPASGKGKPRKTQVLANYPNPFNPETWIPYELAEGSEVTIKIYNVSGLLIRTLDLGHRPAGFYATRDRAAYWNGENEAGEQVSSGIYFYNIQAGEYTDTKKMIVVR